MKTWRCVAPAILLIACISGGSMAVNVLQTATPIGSEHLTLTFGIGLATSEAAGVTSWHFTPQLRMALGVSDGIDLAFQSGILSTIGSTEVSILGAILDAKFALVHAPGMYTMAWGAGAGYGLDFLGQGWGVFGQFFFESHARLFPVYVVYRGILPIDGGAIRFVPYTGIGVHLPLAPSTLLLLGADFYLGEISIGLGLNIWF